MVSTLLPTTTHSPSVPSHAVGKDDSFAAARKVMWSGIQGHDEGYKLRLLTSEAFFATREGTLEHEPPSTLFRFTKS